MPRPAVAPSRATYLMPRPDAHAERSGGQSFADAVAALCVAHERELAQLHGSSEATPLHSCSQASARPSESRLRGDWKSDLQWAAEVSGLIPSEGSAARPSNVVRPSEVESIMTDAICDRWVVLLEGLRQQHALPQIVPFEIQPYWSSPQIGGPSSPTHYRQKKAIGWDTVDMEGMEDRPNQHSNISWLAHPDSLWRVGWFSVGLVSLVWDLFTVPLHVFELGGFAQTLNGIAIVSILYWALDLLLQFRIGFRTGEGRVETRTSEISRTYLRTWFFPDLAVLCIDICILNLVSRMDDAGSDMLGTVRFARFLRMLRLVRLIRARRLRQAVHSLSSRIGSEIVLIAFNLMKFVLIILVFSHYVACAWYAIAAWSGETNTWIQAVSDETATSFQKYLLSLHWSLTQFSPSTTDIAPTNGAERLFACLVALSAMLVFTTLVSNVTNFVNQIRMVNLDFYMEQKHLNEFMLSRHLSSTLFGRIQTFFQKNYKKSKAKLLETDIKFIALLPDSIKRQMHLEMHMPILRRHYVFDYFYDVDKGEFLMRCSHEAVQEVLSLAGYDLFVRGSVAEGMLYPLDGQVEYEISEVVQTASGVEERVLVEKPDVRQWFSEMSVWIVWHHVGRLTANSRTSAMFFRADAIGEILPTCNLQSLVYPCLRATAIFCTQLADDAQEAGKKLTDLPCNEEEIRATCQRARNFKGASSLRPWS